MPPLSEAEPRKMRARGAARHSRGRRWGRRGGCGGGVPEPPGISQPSRSCGSAPLAALYQNTEFWGVWGKKLRSTPFFSDGPRAWRERRDSAKKKNLNPLFPRGPTLTLSGAGGWPPSGIFLCWGPPSPASEPPRGDRSRGGSRWPPPGRSARCLFSSSPVIKSFLKA